MNAIKEFLKNSKLWGVSEMMHPFYVSIKINVSRDSIKSN